MIGYSLCQIGSLVQDITCKQIGVGYHWIDDIINSDYNCIKIALEMNCIEMEVLTMEKLIGINEREL